MKSIIPYGKQTITKSDTRLLSKVLNSYYLTTGPKVINFERLFKKKVGSKFAATSSNGTSALHLAFLAIGLKKDDKVIMPTINFVSAANMAKILGAQIFLADVDSQTGLVTKDTLEECIRRNKIKKLKLILVMHHAGFPDYGKELLHLKKKYKCFIIEDACHSLGGSYSKKKKLRVGSCKFSDISTFSFHPVKSITTGEGGMLTMNNKKLYEKVILYRSHCIKKKKIINTNLFLGYKIVGHGFNYRLSDINSALGISQLKRLKTFIKKRTKIANKYYNQLSDLKDYITLPQRKEDVESAWHLFVLKINFNKLNIGRNVLFKNLYQKGIVTQVHYPPIYKHPVFKKT